MSVIQVGPHNVAVWERFLPVQSNAKDWQSYQSFKGETSDNLGRRLRFLSLAQLVRRVAEDRIPGKYIECGSLMGHSAHVIASTMTQCGVRQRLMLFDSFEGLSPATKEDFNVAPGHVDIKGIQSNLRAGVSMFASPIETAMHNLEEHDFIDYYKGWIPETFAGHENEQFAFGHIDVDLYQPVKASLEFVYPRMATGGIIQIDDYNFIDWPGANQAVDEFLAAAKPSFFFELPLGGAFLIK